LHRFGFVRQMLVENPFAGRPSSPADQRLIRMSDPLFAFCFHGEQ